MSAKLAADLGNVSKACRVMDYSRQQFYEIRRNFQTYGVEGLHDKIAGARPPHPNRVKAILDHSVAHPCHGALRVANELVLAGIQASSTGGDTAWSAVTTGCCAWEKALAERTRTLSGGATQTPGTTVAFIVRADLRHEHGVSCDDCTTHVLSVVPQGW
jgi:hypothetical protein